MLLSTTGGTVGWMLNCVLLCFLRWREGYRQKTEDQGSCELHHCLPRLYASCGRNWMRMKWSHESFYRNQKICTLSFIQTIGRNGSMQKRRIDKMTCDNLENNCTWVFLQDYNFRVELRFIKYYFQASSSSTNQKTHSLFRAKAFSLGSANILYFVNSILVTLRMLTFSDAPVDITYELGNNCWR